MSKIKFNICVNRGGEIVTEEVEGREVVIRGLGELRFVIHKSIGSAFWIPRWTISEFSTGRAVCFSDSRADLRKGVIALLEKRGKEDFLATVAKLPKINHLEKHAEKG